MHNRLALIVFTMLLAVTAQGKTTAEKWNAAIDQSATHLRAGEFAQSLKISQKLVRQMIDQLGRGEPAKRAFAIVLTHKALALAGLGRNDDALWDWHTALTLYPAAEATDLSSFGEAGAFLAANSEPRTLEKTDRVSTEPITATVKAPVILKKVEPTFPGGAHFFGTEGAVVVNVMVTREGKVTSPVVVQTLAAPTLSYVALEALRKWKFRPGTLNGEPVDVVFEFTANYKP